VHMIFYTARFSTLYLDKKKFYIVLMMASVNINTCNLFSDVFTDFQRKPYCCIADIVSGV